MKTIKVHLLDEAFISMGAAADREGISCTDVINRALQVYAWLGAIEPDTEATLNNADGTTWMTVVKP